MSIVNLNNALDLVDLFEQFFGYKPAVVPEFPPSYTTGPAERMQAITRKKTNMYGTPLYGQADMMGREVFCPVTIEVDGKDYYFPFCVIGCDRDKTVVETEMTELNGSVKEIIGNRDWIFTIKGFVIGQYEQFPDEQLKMLDEVAAFNQTVRLKSAYSDIFLHANDQVLIYKLSIPEKPKVIGVRDFAMQAKSDGIFTLYQN